MASPGHNQSYRRTVGCRLAVGVIRQPYMRTGACFWVFSAAGDFSSNKGLVGVEFLSHAPTPDARPTDAWDPCMP